LQQNNHAHFKVNRLLLPLLFCELGLESSLLRALARFVCLCMNFWSRNTPATLKVEQAVSKDILGIALKTLGHSCLFCIYFFRPQLVEKRDLALETLIEFTLLTLSFRVSLDYVSAGISRKFYTGISSQSYTMRRKVI
jgi:hypothetical protein